MAQKYPTTPGQLTLDFEKKISAGLEINKEGKVLRVLPTSALLGSIFVNDIIKSVNEKPFATPAQIVVAMTSSTPGKLVIDYERDETCTVKHKSTPATGYERILVEMAWRSGGTQLGLLINKNKEGRIAVISVDPNLPAVKFAQPGDLIQKIGSKDCVDKDIAKKDVCDSINRFRRVNMILERPPPVEAAAGNGDKSYVPTTMGTVTEGPPPADVMI